MALKYSRMFKENHRILTKNPRTPQDAEREPQDTADHCRTVLR